MDVLVTGGTGFVGRSVCRTMLNDHHTVTALSRSARAAERLPSGVNYILGDPSKPGPWQGEAAEFQGYINLAGASIFGRWSKEYKDLIYQSRIRSTQNLVQAMGKGDNPQEKVLISASAVGYYGFHGDEELDESSPPGDDFLARVCRDWESRANKARNLGATVITSRFGIVLGPRGGALSQMLPIFKRGLGGPLGRGGQWFSWIHLHDLSKALLFILNRAAKLEGAVNCTAPHPVTNRELGKALGRALSKPSWLPAPGFAVRLALGEFGSTLLKGQRVLPQRLNKSAFSFKYPTLPEALADITT